MCSRPDFFKKWLFSNFNKGFQYVNSMQLSTKIVCNSYLLEKSYILRRKKVFGKIHTKAGLGGFEKNRPAGFFQNFAVCPNPAPTSGGLSTRLTRLSLGTPGLGGPKAQRPPRLRGPHGLGVPKLGSSQGSPA
jgi:hypothetical protein